MHADPRTRLAGLFPPPWRAEAGRVPRDRFVPDTVWVADGGEPVPVDRREEPERWLELCHENRPLVTQLDDGAGSGRGYITSSASQPSIVGQMLESLDLRPGHRVLEIGTGTGWNAALLAERAGAENVTTVEIDPALADRAREVLIGSGCPVAVVTGDGVLGCPGRGPYDRVLSTAAVQRVPYAWVEQTRPGGLILTPWGTTFDNGVLAGLTVAADGTASGRFTGDAAFMWVRSQRRPHAVVEDEVRAEHDHDEGTTFLHPYEPIADPDARFAIGLALAPGASDVLVFDDDDPDRPYTVYLLAPESGSWASWRVEPGTREYAVRQHGPRELFVEVERAYRRWVAAGRPARGRFGLTVTPEGQTVWLDEPERVFTAEGGT